ncbi:ankyrin repeat-containing domain protein [Podospora australis]|uniref:Ankyrin repeat-containing domain protein n=1 Tax=Podospora australis TaxID=1536484 RepID=A0AAN6WNK8_9PEZI|nr:ankyrin repeat-containing domain protein [Podospora australis]
MFSSLSFRPGSGKSAAHQKLLFTDLCQACQDGNLGWARNQVSEGADVNSIDAIFNSPLSYAIKRGDLAIVKLLVEEGGARVGGADGRSSAMVFSAVQSRNIPILTYLLDKSAPISSVCGDSKDRGSWKTPLALAVETGQLEAVKLLVEHGADVNGSEQANSSPKGLTPLCTAADRHYPAITELLLQYQARINASESCADWGSFLTALHVASYRGHDDIVDILLSAGADAALTCTTTMPSKTTGVTALHISTGACATKLLASPGASIFARDSAGQFPLSGAVMVRSVESVRTLLGKSAPVNAQNRKGETALHIACRLFAKEAKRGRPDHLKDYRAIAAELVDGGANPGSKKAARIIIITECKKLLAQLKEDGEDEEERERRTYKRGLFETMDAVAGLVEKQAAERKREAFSSNGATADDGPKEVPRRYVAQSSLAFGY